MLINEYDSVAGLVSKPSKESIERDRQIQLAYVQNIIQQLTDTQHMLHVHAAGRVAAA